MSTEQPGEVGTLPARNRRALELGLLLALYAAAIVGILVSTAVVVALDPSGSSLWALALPVVGVLAAYLGGPGWLRVRGAPSLPFRRLLLRRSRPIYIASLATAALAVAVGWVQLGVSTAVEPGATDWLIYGGVLAAGFALGALVAIVLTVVSVSMEDRKGGQASA